MRTWGTSWQTSWGDAFGTADIPPPRLAAWGVSWLTSWGEAWGEVPTPQVLVPATDITAGAWLSSTGSSLASTLDEASANDADYCYTRSHSTMEIKFGLGNDPNSAIGHIVRYRLRGNGTTNAIVKLKQGTTVIATWTEVDVPTSVTAFSHTLGAAEADSITDYADLRLSIEATA